MRTRKETLINAARAQLKKFFKTCSVSAPPFWDGKAAERIVEILAKEQYSESRIQNPEYRIQNTESRIQNPEYRIELDYAARSDAGWIISLAP